MTNDIESILFSAVQIETAVEKAAQKINAEYSAEPPIVLGLLNGCFMFFADVVRRIKIECNVDFMCVSSYGGGTKSNGSPKILKSMSLNPQNRRIIIAEDIVDSGNTLAYITKYLLASGAKDVKIYTLLDKPSGRTTDICLQWTGFTVDNQFVVGYGMDYDNKYRNLPYIGILKKEIYL